MPWCFFLLPALLIFTTPCSLAGQDLKLKETEAKILEIFDRPNPHFDLACSDCHERRPAMGVDNPETVTFVNGLAGNVDLCYGCHDPATNIHPINRDPVAAIPPVNVPSILPLESRGENRGKVVCSTCHFIHSRTAGLKLLRGFPESSNPADIEKAIYKDRRDLCKACHKKSLAAKTPHKGKQGGTETCSFCHSRVPEEGREAELTQGLVQVCDFCHGATKGAHYLLVNPFADPTLQEAVDAGTLPLQGGGYTCISCHNPHGKTGEPKFLRKEFVDLALRSKRVRPHFQVSFCQACHRVKPTAPRGSPQAQKLAQIPLLSEDPNALCNRCHESGLSKANAHPLREISDTIRTRIPGDWPLFQGTLTCLTCHTAGDSPAYNPQNPSFLRGGPYEFRNDMCWKCHIREELASFNPHLNINDGQSCEFCHDTRPDTTKSVDVSELTFKGDIVLLCMRCHEILPHPADSNHNGLPDVEIMVRANIILPEGFPLDAEGRLNCATCHNPHVGDPGAVRGVAVGMEICSSCHKWGGEKSMATGEMAVRERGLRAPGTTPSLSAPAPDPAEEGVIVRQHLDAGRLQFSGMDINGDGIADSIRLDGVKRSLVYFVGNERGNFISFDPVALPDEDRRFVPDILVEEDLDGDEIEDLLLYNRNYLEKYAAREQVLLRILTGGIYIGQPKGHFQSLEVVVLSGEAKSAIQEKARNILFPGP